jgi:hypothetical protein
VAACPPDLWIAMAELHVRTRKPRNVGHDAMIDDPTFVTSLQVNYIYGAMHRDVVSSLLHILYQILYSILILAMEGPWQARHWTGTGPCTSCCLVCCCVTFPSSIHKENALRTLSVAK